MIKHLICYLFHRPKFEWAEWDIDRKVARCRCQKCGTRYKIHMKEGST